MGKSFGLGMKGPTTSCWPANVPPSLCSLEKLWFSNAPDAPQPTSTAEQRACCCAGGQRAPPEFTMQDSCLSDTKAYLFMVLSGQILNGNGYKVC